MWFHPRGRSNPPIPAVSSPLLPYESCNLGSINLVKMLAKTPEGYAVDYGLLRDTVRRPYIFWTTLLT